MINDTEGKIIPSDNLSNFRQDTGSRTIVLAGGCFDLFHYGHLKFLQAAKEKGDILVIALESDEHIQKSKKRKPFHTQSERAQILAALSITDYIILLPYMNTDEEYFELTRTISPRVIAVTRGDPQIRNKELQAESVGATVVAVTPVVKNISTTRIFHYADES